MAIPAVAHEFGMPVLAPSPVLTMVAAKWPATCGKDGCAHPMCLRIHESARRLCHLCERPIEPGLQYVEFRNPHNGALNFQEHVSCQEVKS